MKDLIKTALDQVAANLKTPSTKTVVEFKSVSIMDVNPLDLVGFMKDNDIPADAYFDGRDNGYDAFDDILLTWEVRTTLPTTDDDKIAYNRKTFNNRAFRSVYALLTANGYKRKGYNTGLLKQFDDTTFYDMYISGAYDRLVDYYSLPFEKIDN
jgi:hypothetical protein